MPRKSTVLKSPPDGFINVPVTKQTREGLHTLKVAMNASGQGEVIEKLVAIAMAIQKETMRE